MNIFDYIEKYGNVSFKEKSINDVDILLFSCLAYNDYASVLPTFYNKCLLKDNLDNLIEYNSKSDGLSRTFGVNLLKALKNKNRYQDLIIKNYYYELGENHQFGAITIETNKTLYICFEGTDSTIQGWKENFSLSYLYPSQSQLLSMEYLDNVLRFNTKPVYICGHSKGGNLAVVSALNINFLERNNIQKIYSFDGPGLHNGVYGSDGYNKIKSKIVNIIPEQSLFGIFLYQDTPIVIKANDKGLMQHSVENWLIDDDKFYLGIQSKESIEFKDTLERWIYGASLEERKELVDILFDVLQNSNIERVSDISKDLKTNILNIYKSYRELSKETKDMAWNSLKNLAVELSKYRKDTINSKIRILINKNEK